MRNRYVIMNTNEFLKRESEIHHLVPGGAKFAGDGRILRKKRGDGIVEEKLKVLIVDDSMLLRKKLRGDLEKQNCEVFEANNGREAVRLFLQTRMDGVFMDLVMPEVGGMEALKAMREIDKTAYIIMLSSAGTAGKLVETLKAGAADFIQKPYTPEQIGYAVANMRKRANRHV